MELLLIRHAEPERVVGQGGGRADPSLTARGRTQAERLAAWLAPEKPTAIWTSPQRRAVETALPLAEAIGREAQIDDGLAEYDRDSPDYIHVDELKRTNHPRWQAMVEGRWEDLASVSNEEFNARVEAALTRCIAAHPGEKIAVFCHGGVVNAWIGALLGIAHPLWLDAEYTSISRVAASRSGVRSVRSLNETAHLRDLER